MKKIYTKPSLHAERFAVEDIMTEVIAEKTSAVTSLYYMHGTAVISPIAGFVNFTSDNIHKIDYTQFN